MAFIDNSGPALVYLLRRFFARFRDGLRESRERRKLLEQVAALESRPLQQVSNGPWAVEGTVEEITVERAPLSRRPVVGYRLILEQVERNDIEWRRLLDVRRLHPFRLRDDDDHVATVLPRGAQLLLRPLTWPVDDLLKILGPELSLLLQRNGISTTTLVAARRLRVLEYAILPGLRLFVQGVARRTLDPLGEPNNYRELPTVLHIGGEGERRLLLADRPRRELLLTLQSRRLAGALS